MEDGELGDDITALSNQFGIPLTFNAFIQVSYAVKNHVSHFRTNTPGHGSD